MSIPVILCTYAVNAFVYNLFCIQEHLGLVLLLLLGDLRVEGRYPSFMHCVFEARQLDLGILEQHSCEKEPAYLNKRAIEESTCLP